MVDTKHIQLISPSAVTAEDLMHALRCVSAAGGSLQADHFDNNMTLSHQHRHTQSDASNHEQKGSQRNKSLTEHGRYAMHAQTYKLPSTCMIAAFSCTVMTRNNHSFDSGVAFKSRQEALASSSGFPHFKRSISPCLAYHFTVSRVGPWTTVGHPHSILCEHPRYPFLLHPRM